MMNENIEQLTYDNDFLNKHWPNIFTRIHQTSIINDIKLVLMTLVDYALTHPINSSPCNEK